MAGPSLPSFTGRFRRWAIACSMVELVLLVTVWFPVGPAPAQAQNQGRVQVLDGRIEPGRIVFYNLAGLRQGDTLYAYVEGVSGNLDPFVAVTDTSEAALTLRDRFLAERDKAVAAGRDPYEALPEILDKLTLAWDDDAGAGYDAAMEFQIPEDGDYRLLVAGGEVRGTFGDYKLTVGLNAPQVLTGEAEPVGEGIAEYDREASLTVEGVQEVSGNLTAEERSTRYVLNVLDEGDTLYAYVEATTGDLRPILELEDYGGKVLRSGNLGGNETFASLEYTPDEQAVDYALTVSACCDEEEMTTGGYRLLVGVNEADVLTGDVAIAGEPVIREPIVVDVAVFIDQITNVDQTAENFGVVGTVTLEWTDPALAYSPDECQCSVKILRGTELDDFIIEAGVNWPEFTFFNQQERRFAQNRLAVIRPAGEVLYFERFTTILQAPDFDFREYPFDEQQFFVRVDSLLPEDRYLYRAAEGESGVGEQLGEEEWYITEFDTSIGSQEYGSRFSFRFEARRHLNYYVMRILLPVFLIILVSWATFFIRDYVKRVEVGGANLLVFVAFNFVIGGDLPRLGYLTFMDAILMATFIITALVVVFNVILARLEVVGRGELAARIDRFSIWGYMLAYAITFGVAGALLL